MLGTSASPNLYVALGAFLMLLGGLLATDFRGLGTRYIRLTLRNAPQTTVDRYRIWYGIVSAIGLVMFVSGLVA